MKKNLEDKDIKDEFIQMGMKIDKKILFILIGIVIIAIIGFQVFKNPEASENINNFNGNVKEFSVVAKEWEFEPAVIEVNKGDKVILNLESVDVNHGITINELGVNVEIKAGEMKKIEFIADKTGEFNFFCNVYCGDGHSDMVGKLVVN